MCGCQESRELITVRPRQPVKSPMRALHYSLILVLSFAVVGCAEDALTTGSIEHGSNRGAIDTSKAARVEPIHALSSDTKRAWCEMRLRDVRAGKPPLGETNTKQIEAGNALCRQAP